MDLSVEHLSTHVLLIGVLQTPQARWTPVLDLEVRGRQLATALSALSLHSAKCARCTLCRCV